MNTTLILLRAAQAGEAQAMDQLLERYRDRLLQVVALLLGRRRSGLLEDAEDLVQDTLLDAFHDLRSFTPRTEGAFLHWLSKLAANNLRDAVRRGNAQRRGGGRVRPRADLSTAFLVRSVFPGTEPSPSQVAERNELYEQLEALLIALPEHERRAFVMRRLCDASYDEVATELGLANAASARALYSRTMTRVLAQLPDSPGI